MSLMASSSEPLIITNARKEIRAPTHPLQTTRMMIHATTYHFPKVVMSRSVLISTSSMIVDEELHNASRVEIIRGQQLLALQPIRAQIGHHVHPLLGHVAALRYAAIGARGITKRGAKVQQIRAVEEDHQIPGQPTQP